MKVMGFLSAVVIFVSILTFMLYMNLLTYSNDFSDKQGILKLIAGARGPYLPYLRLLILSILTSGPNVSFLLARLISDNSGSLKKFELGRRANPEETVFCTGSEFLFVATCALDLTFLALLTLEK